MIQRGGIGDKGASGHMSLYNRGSSAKAWTSILPTIQRGGIPDAIASKEYRRRQYLTQSEVCIGQYNSLPVPGRSPWKVRPISLWCVSPFLSITQGEKKVKFHCKTTRCRRSEDMGVIAFLILILWFFYIMSDKFPDQMRELFSRVIGLLPSFRDNKASDLKAFAYSVTVMAFLLLLIICFRS